MRARSSFVLAVAVVALAAVAPGTATAAASDPPPPPAVTNLDASGTSIPYTSYPVPPTGVVYMDPNGNDAGSGSSTAPVRSLLRATQAVPAGGTIVARAGVYRTGSSTSVSKTFTLQPAQGAQVWFDGTDVVGSGWEHYTANGVDQWRHAWSTPSFCANGYTGGTNAWSLAACLYADNAGDAANPAAGDPQMVFVDGAYVHEVTSAPAAVGANFYYDLAGQYLYLGVDPAAHTVELTARSMALALEGSTTGGTVVRGIGFRRYATTPRQGVRDHGAVLVNVPGTTFENDVFSQNAGAGLSYANPSGASITTSVFAADGANGLDMNGHASSGSTPDNPVITASVFDADNSERFGSACTAACAAAGAKLAHMNGYTVRDSLFEDNAGKAHGFWCDLQCTNGTTTGSVFLHNGGHGLFYEVSASGLIASNMMYANGGYGLKLGSATTRVFHNTILGNANGVLVYDDDRTGSGVGPDTTGLDVTSNIVSGPGVLMTLLRTTATCPNTGPLQNFFPGADGTGLDYNAYYRTSGSSQVLLQLTDTPTGACGSGTRTTTSYTTAAGFTAHGWESHGVFAAGGAEPFFVDPSVGDYSVRAGSIAYENGAPLPPDVAAAMGQPAGSVLNRGYLATAVVS